MSRKDYNDNWESEMHETFCFWDFDEWKAHLTGAGYRIEATSNAYANPWIIENRLKGKVTLYTTALEELPYPVTNMMMIASKS
jgi:hypothetical protein